MPTYPDCYQIIDKMKNRYPITWLAEMAEIQRSNYYKWLKNGKVSLRKQDDILLKEHILTIHQPNKMYGYPRVKIALRDKDLKVNYKKVYRLMCELGIQSIIRKKRHVWKNRVSRTFENLLERQFKDRAENEVFATDNTFLPTKTGCIIHSVQGFPYTSLKYHQTVEQLGMIGSHSRKGNCHDNACIESAL